MKYIVYILRTSGDTLYTGITNNLEKRLLIHKKKTKRSAKYLRPFSSLALVYVEEFASKGDALRREIEIKKLTKRKKENLISSHK